MTSASMPETNSENPKSPPAPSSGAPPTSLSPVSQERSPSRRAMNPSTLMPRNTDPVKEDVMAATVPERYDDSHPRRRGGEPYDRVTGLLHVAVMGDADDDPAGQGRAQVGHERRGGRCVQVRGRLVEEDDVPVGQQRAGRGQPTPLTARQGGATGAHLRVQAVGERGEQGAEPRHGQRGPHPGLAVGPR